MYLIEIHKYSFNLINFNRCLEAEILTQKRQKLYYKLFKSVSKLNCVPG